MARTQREASELRSRLNATASKLRDAAYAGFHAYGPNWPADGEFEVFYHEQGAKADATYGAHFPRQKARTSTR